MTAAAEQPELFFATPEAFEAWMEEHHATSDGVWLRFAKKGTGIQTLTYGPALDVALCFGWIDGQSRRVDDLFYLQRFTPRRKRSLWSKRNRVKVGELVEAGRMRPAGLAEIERAKADGRWDAAYDSPSTSEVPEDLRAALDASPAAAEAFAALNATNRYAVLHRVQTAVKPETRARRIAKFVGMLERGEQLHP